MLVIFPHVAGVGEGVRHGEQGPGRWGFVHVAHVKQAGIRCADRTTHGERSVK